jgi:hypothetical protein
MSVQGALAAGVKRPGREANNSRPFGAKSKTPWSYTSSWLGT